MKHRGEPVIKFVVEMMESERGWGQNFWDVEFDTREEAEAYFAEVNARNTSPVAPDYYIQAQSIKEVQQ